MRRNGLQRLPTSPRFPIQLAELAKLSKVQFKHEERSKIKTLENLFGINKKDKEKRKGVNMTGWNGMVWKEGDICKTLRVITDAGIIFNYGDKVKILKTIPAQPGHPYHGYIVYSLLSGRNEELREEELELC